MRLICILIVSWTGLVLSVAAQTESPAERGRRLLLEKPYVPASLDDEIFADLWRSWDPDSRRAARDATPGRRREMTFRRYGLTPRPGDPSKPLQFAVVDGQWSMNCFACHGGRVGATPLEGLGNSHLALQSLVEDTVATKRRLGRKLSLRELIPFPQGSTIGTTNCVAFGVVLGSLREPDLKVRATPKKYGKLIHHDMDAPAWWLYPVKTRLYTDGHGPKGHRELMQFVLTPNNGPEKFREWEDEFRDIEAYLESIAAPRFPGRVDRELVERGRVVFDRVCSRCHGTYGERIDYPAKTIKLSVIRTDPLRHRALTTKHLTALRASWFAEGRRDEVEVAPEGYVAPPLIGVWASAPYLHNGSVPTLAGVFDSTARPTIWRRDPEGYDLGAEVGAVVDVLEAVPEDLTRYEKRRVFDTRVPGKSNGGHRFGDGLEPDERRAVIEYLKTL